MSTPKKLPSGAWNVRVYVGKDADNKSVYTSVTRPTKAECELAAAEIKMNRKKTVHISRKKTVRNAIEEYITLSELLSPTTLASYEVILRNGFPDIMDVPVADLSDTAMQIAINSEAKRRNERTGKVISPKTVKNEYGLLAAALKTVCNRTFKVRLPSVQHKNELLPEPSEVMAAIRGTDSELPCLLAMWCGMRMSEIRGLQFKAIHDGFIWIDRVLVEVNGKPVLKELAKTDSSIRRIQIPEQIARLMEKSAVDRVNASLIAIESLPEAFVVEGTHSEIYGAFQRALKPYGIKMRFHDLRHIFASSMLNVLGVAPKLVQIEGGWSSPSVMSKIYSQGISSAQIAADNARDTYFNSLYFDQI